MTYDRVYDSEDKRVKTKYWNMAIELQEVHLCGKVKKFMLIFSLIFIMIQSVFVVNSFAAEKTVKASLPTFRVQINGTIVDSKTAEYPLLVYKNITYMPMTYDYCNLLGLESEWTKAKGLTVSLRKNGTIPTITESSAKCSNPSSVVANVVSTPITINNTKIDNLNEPYPFLRYGDVTYFPLTYKFTNKAFNIYTNFLPDSGLGVYSENKFFYKYYPKNSKLQSTDLRISSILYLMTAINISDGTGNYPSNNVKQYCYQDNGKALLPNYKGIKYYGYLPDGNGGLKVNMKSKLSTGWLQTTEIANTKNPKPIQVELGFFEYYGE